MSTNTENKRDTQGGSKDWIQQLINFKPRLEREIGKGTITWISPLESESYTEYQLNSPHIKKTFDFDDETVSLLWPKGCHTPQWDAIGRADSDDTIILVEAKAHTSETNSPCGSKNNENIEKIVNHLCETCKYINPAQKFNKDIWMGEYYQTANRLSVWHNLKKEREVILVFLNFVEVPEAKFKTSLSDWEDHMKKVFDDLLGTDVKLPEGIKVIYFDVSK